MRKLLAIVLLFYSFFVFAQVKQIRGTVVNKWKKPLQKVQIFSPTGKKLSETDIRGSFVFNYNIPMRGEIPKFTFKKFNFQNYIWEYDRVDNKEIILTMDSLKFWKKIYGNVFSESGKQLTGVSITQTYNEWSGSRNNNTMSNSEGFELKVVNPSMVKVNLGNSLSKYVEILFELEGYKTKKIKTTYDKIKKRRTPFKIILIDNELQDDFPEGAIHNPKKINHNSENNNLTELHEALEDKHEEIDSTTTLSGDKLVELKEYIAYLENVLESNNVEFNQNALGQDSTIHKQLKTKVEELKNKVAEKEKEVKKEKKKNTFLWWAIAAIILFLIPSILAIVFYINNKKTKKLNVQLDAQNTELKKAYHNIHSSVVYAQRIQQSILVKPTGIKNHFNDAFVFFRPKDIVSGDFYWFAQVESKLIITAVDCTGHGVPGAFMTMMGNSILNEIVNERKITEPSEILSELHKKIQLSLKASGETNSNDGMDIALTCVDSESKKIKFAGANNPLYFISNKEFKTIKGERNGLGGTKNDTQIKFTNHELDVSEVDCFYLVSDGFQDQFGGTENRKYMKKRFKNLLLDISEKPFNEQEKILDKELVSWKGNHEQTDDILVIGIKI